MEDAPSAFNEYVNAKKQRKYLQLLRDTNALFEQKRIELLYWQDITEKMGINLTDIEGIEKLVIDNTKLSDLFPELLFSDTSDDKNSDKQKKILKY
ncbi:hypothetical protein UB51_04120 [Paenibacillus sp. IHBB 10380]|nr:hypothetical protein UB51_04120 [Paenibacillus sp. IHBB 10380]